MLKKQPGKIKHFFASYNRILILLYNVKRLYFYLRQPNLLSFAFTLVI